MAVVCPECDNPIMVEEDVLEAGEMLECEECGTNLEVIGVAPLEVVTVDEEGYDDEDLPPIRGVDED